MMMNYEDYKEERARISRLASKRVSYSKGSVIQSHCFCSLCAGDLTRIVLKTGKKFARYPFSRMTINEFVHMNVCKEPKMCYNRYKEFKGGKQNGNE